MTLLRAREVVLSRGGLYVTAIGLWLGTWSVVGARWPGTSDVLFAVLFGWYLTIAALVHRLLEAPRGQESRGTVTLPTVLVEDRARLRVMLADAHRVRVFASRGAHYRQFFEETWADTPPTTRVAIEVLLRHDGTRSRATELCREARRWQALCDRGPVSVDVRVHPFEHMLRGLIADDTKAAIGWYRHAPNGTKGIDRPMALVQRTNRTEVDTIQVVGEVFDRRFGRAAEAGIRSEDYEIGALLLDLDGTLYDAPQMRTQHEAALVRAVAATHHLSEDDARARLRSLRQTETYRRAPLSALAEPLEVDPATVRQTQAEVMEPERFLSENPRLAAALAAAAQEMHVVLLTNTPRQVAVRMLAALGIPEACFAVIRTADELVEHKPSVTEVARVIADAGASARYSVALGDRDHVDLAPASELGLTVHLVGGPDDVCDWIDARV